MLYEKLPNKKVQCNLCAHRCKITDQKFGLCGVRQNLDSTLYTYTYGEAIAAHIDPIEKKPLYHFCPGSTAFSIATAGCNFKCPFCQNWQISQVSKRNGNETEGHRLMPEEIVKEARQNHCKSISYTYTEPTIFFEYAYDTAKIAKKNGLYNNFVTNGYMTEEALRTINPYLDAANVDLKFFKDSSYKNICKASLEPVLNSIRLMKELNIWVEITTLVIPGENDSEEELQDIAKFIASLDKDIPWHISRFHPDYKYVNNIPTPLETLKKAESIGKRAGLKYTYIGNVYREGEVTNCPECGKILIKRVGFTVTENHLAGFSCSYCNTTISGVFK